jgi:hypothetical protein
MRVYGGEVRVEVDEENNLTDYFYLFIGILKKIERIKRGVYCICSIDRDYVGPK